jgi:ribosome-binding protein aMBF1 (putative translation factor)
MIEAATEPAARALAGLEQRQVAAKAKINPTTLHRMEGSEDKPTRGHAGNVERVIEVLRKAGVEMTQDPRGVRLISRK